MAINTGKIPFTPTTEAGLAFARALQKAPENHKIDQEDLTSLSTAVEGIAAGTAERDKAQSILDRMKSLDGAAFEPGAITFNDKNQNQTIDLGENLEISFPTKEADVTPEAVPTGDTPAQPDTPPELAQVPATQAEQEQSYQTTFDTKKSSVEAKAAVEHLIGTDGTGGLLGEQGKRLASAKTQLQTAIDLRKQSIPELEAKLKPPETDQTKPAQEALAAVKAELAELESQMKPLDDKIAAVEQARKAVADASAPPNGTPQKGVEALQTFLKTQPNLGENLTGFQYKGKKDGVDGQFGFRTHASTQAFLKRNELPSPPSSAKLDAAIQAVNGAAQASTNQAAADQAAADRAAALQADADKKQTAAVNQQVGALRNELGRKNPDKGELRKMIRDPNFAEAVKAEPQLVSQMLNKYPKLFQDDEAAFQMFYNKAGEAGQRQIAHHALQSKDSDYLESLPKGWSKYMSPAEMPLLAKAYGNVTSGEQDALGKIFASAPAATQIAFLNYYGKDDDEEGVVAALREFKPDNLRAMLQDPQGLEALETAVRSLDGPNHSEYVALNYAANLLQQMQEDGKNADIVERIRTLNASVRDVRGS